MPRETVNVKGDGGYYIQIRKYKVGERYIVRNGLIYGIEKIPR